MPTAWYFLWLLRKSHVAAAAMAINPSDSDTPKAVANGTVWETVGSAVGSREGTGEGARVGLLSSTATVTLAAYRADASDEKLGSSSALRVSEDMISAEEVASNALTAVVARDVRWFTVLLLVIASEPLCALSRADKVGSSQR